jgi:hypothetical protein
MESVFTIILGLFRLYLYVRHLLERQQHQAPLNILEPLKRSSLVALLQAQQKTT